MPDLSLEVEYPVASTAENPLNNILDTSRIGKFSSAARKFFTEINKDTRYGKVAMVNAPRVARVLSKFVIKATGRDNIRFFENEEEAVNWVKQKDNLAQFKSG